jgi:Uma2 family endonuclease
MTKTPAVAHKFTLIEDLYEPAEFVGAERIQSSTFPDLQLTVEQVFSAGDEQ